MASSSISNVSRPTYANSTYQTGTLSRVLVPLGRALFVTIFLIAVPFHFSQQEIGYAAHSGVPMAQFLVPAAGIIALLGGLGVLLGYRAKIGAWLLILFLVPVTLALHNFWAVTDPMMRQMQFAHFLKNLSMIGAALMLTQFGPGPVSFDERR